MSRKGGNEVERARKSNVDERVGKSCQKIIWGQGWPKNNNNKKGGPGEKKVSWEKEIKRKNKTQKKIKTVDHVNCPLGNSFIPFMKFQNGIF